jgi:hypothetical protein
MAEPKLRTIRKTRNKSKRFKRSEVRKMILRIMAERGEVPTPMPPPRKRTAAARK